MNNIQMRFLKLLGMFVFGMFVGWCNAALALDDSAALAGIKEGKIAFDMKEGDAKKLLGQLGIIEETRESLIKQGVKTHIILTFRGPASKLVQTDQEKIKLEDRDIAAKIAAKLKAMRKAPGIEGFEQCSLASRQQETNTELVLPEIKVVENGFISLMAYQIKGYTYIAP
jgi:intracellular sulfur oxidation DsrE/DsrF family protein